MNDYQVSRVYAWEQRHVPNGDWIPFDKAQAAVNHIWDTFGLQYPPKVKAMAPNVKKWAGAANRHKVLLPARGCNSRVLLHELAHSMTMNLENVGHQHNEYFVGMYIALVERFMNVAGPLLHHTAMISGVKSIVGVTPTITDSGIFYK